MALATFERYVAYLSGLKACRQQGVVAHSFIASTVLRHVSQCRSRTGFNTHGLTFAQVALTHHARIRIIVNGAKGASDGTDLAAHTGLGRNLLAPVAGLHVIA